jgi:hypothetical protein
MICFAPEKHTIPCIFSNRGTLVFYVPKRERERRGGEIKSRAREKEKDKDEEKEEEREKKYGRFYF